jgi:tetratricopeptide (TPR) repeat protein
MSLLLDALKRAAEEKLEKQQPQQESAAGAQPAAAQSVDESLSLDITNPPPTDMGNTVLRTHRSDVLASELQDFLDHRDTAQHKVGQHKDPYITAPVATPGQAAQMFESKRTKVPPPRKQRLLIIVGAAGAVLIVGGLFLYLNLRSLNQSNVNISQLQARSSAIPVAAAPAKAAPVDAQLLVEQERASAATLPPTSVAQHATPAVPAVKSTRQPKPGQLSLRKTDQQSLYNTLTRAYEAYTAGELETATIFYRQALDQAPTNRDALLGVAAIEVRQSNYEAALQTYRRLLRLNPRDDLALAGIAGLEQTVRPQTPLADAGESTLKNMLVEKPDSAQLHFTLGNLYAARQEWSKAQSAYFDAHRLDPQNPDYAYNLAVSLDHLQQRLAATRYYETALTLAGQWKAGFDTAQVGSRLLELGSESGSKGTPADAR